MVAHLKRRYRSWNLQRVQHGESCGLIFSPTFLVPILAVMPPVLLTLALLMGVSALGLDAKAMGGILGMGSGVLGMVWIGVLIALILDRAAGRHHIDPQGGHPNPSLQEKWY